MHFKIFNKKIDKEQNTVCSPNITRHNFNDCRDTLIMTLVAICSTDDATPYRCYSNYLMLPNLH